jgi:hypothetical protein
MRHEAAGKADHLPETREQAARRLEALLDRRAEKVKDIPDEALDAVIDEAVDQVRQKRS